MIEAFGRDDWRWINPPREWSMADSGLRAVADARTDLWRTTHYGFVRDNGHMFGAPVTGDFRLAVTFDGEYADQYDQAGAFVRLDETTWIKAGAEFVDGALQLSAVVTRELSDWSVMPAPVRAGSLTFGLERTGDAVTVRYALGDAEPEQMLRLAYFPPGVPVLAGAMCAAPDGKGFPVRFARIDLTESGS
ncbi:hypothetical protein HNP84_002571 [Thermocatellispora tengchongensis]|uniref:DUF1349 domain-containing protein n=1 Tax=Thermocatellispora tengchongensis TaxID=1073253 RepID=A0A840P5V1_9ACTN|nr:DUF1349 domain-containing protein [Thermocatellispora tengchongensis]MBB5132850.1 hypothetical protein [Thermocatellispora tengchongensis]